MAGVASAPALAQAPPSSPPVSRVPKPITVSSDGERPNVLVDQIGTAHVVWNQSTPQGSPDVLHYCRIPRGARTCTGERTFVPPETPPEGNKDFTGPRIVQTSPDEIVVLTHRYPSVVISDDPGGTPNPRCFEENPQDLDKCFGSSNNSTWAYVTDDGGQSFQPPKLLGTGRLSGPPIALTEGFDAPRIAMVSDTETGGTFFQALRPDGYSHAEANLGDEGPNRAYSGSVATLDGAQPIVAFADLTPDVYVRAYRGGPANDVAGWRPSVTAGRGDDPRLAAGPRGMYLLFRTRTATGSRYVVKRVLDATGRVSATSTPVSEIGDVLNRDLFVDGAGGIHAAWVLRSGNGAALHYRVGATATSFGSTLTLATGGASQVDRGDLGAADDGGGFAVWSSTPDGNGVVRAVPFGSQEPLIDVRLTGIEVNQAIQSFDLPARDPRKPTAPVPYKGALLAARAKTVVRVYANSRGPLADKTAPPTVRLRAYRGGKELGTAQGNGLSPVLPEFSPASLVTGGPAAVPLSDRQNSTGAYTFTLPWRWTEGKTTLVAEINPEGLAPSIGECLRCRADNRFTLSDVAYRVTTTVPILPLAMKVNGNQPGGFPDPAPLFTGLIATSPLHIDVQPYQAFLDATYIANDPGLDNTERGDEALEMVDDWSDDNNDELSSLYPIGIYPDGTGIRGATNSDGELYGDEQPMSVISDVRPLTTAAHEVGHGIGRLHAGQDCPQTGPGDDQEGELWSPDFKGLLDGIGLDQRVPSPYRMVASGATDQPAAIFDLMSYCTLGVDKSSWISIRNWDRAVEFRAPPQPSVSRAAAPPLGALGAASARTLDVVAFLSAGKARMSHVTPDDGPATPLQPGSPYSLVARDAAGRELARAGAEVGASRDGPGVVKLDGRVAAAGAASVAFEQAGAAAPVVTRTRSANAPRVSVVGPKGSAPIGASPTVTVRWTATDADRDRLIAWVEYSSDAGRTWKTIAVGESRGSVALPRRMFTVSSNARVRVRVNDGFNETVAVSGRLRSLGAPPEVAIRSPRAGSSYLAGSAVALEGSAWDDAGRALTGSRLRWLDGRRVLGAGKQVTAIGLAPGRRTITLEGKDSRGRLTRRAVVVRIGAVQPLFSTLTVPARVSRRARTVAVRVASTVPATLSAAGRRFAVGLRALRVTLPVKPGRGTLTLALTLTSGGKVTRATRTIARL